MSALSIRGLTVARAGRLVLEDVSFSAPPGALTCVLGPAGAGKTSLMAALAGLLTPERGSVLLDGVDITRVPARRRGIGLLPPGSSLPDTRTLLAALTGAAGRGATALVQDRMALLGLTGLAGRLAGSLSHGEAALALAAARLSMTGGVLLLDEADAGLDAAARDAVLALLRHEAAGGRTIVLATRAPSLALATDHLVLLSAGRLVQAGAPADLYAEPVDEMAARLTGPANILHGTIRELRAGSFVWAADGRYVQVVGADAPRPSLGSKVALCLRPERLEVLGDGQMADNVIEGVVCERRHAGAVRDLSVETRLGRLSARGVHRTDSVRLGWAADAGSVLVQESKQSFFEKKDQKTFAY